MSELLNTQSDLKKSYYSDFIAGIFGGCAGVLAGHPLDTIKVRLQAENSKYRGAWHTLTCIIKEEKIRGLYKGLASPFFGIAIINSLLFGVYGWALDKVSVNDNAPISGYNCFYNSRVFLAGAFSGLINSFLSCPIELVKIRLQNQTKERVYNGNIDLIQKIWRVNGWRGFYRGFGMTVLRETPSYGVYFASYEMLTNQTGSDSSIALLTAGGLAGVLGWTSTYPADSLKTRIQSGNNYILMQAKNENNKNYSGIIRPLKTVYHSEGIKPLFRGLGATAIRAFPTNAVTFYTVILVKTYLDSYA